MDVPILFLEVTVVSQPNYLPDTLFNVVQSKYSNLTNQGLWHPSDKTPEEQTLAMVAQQQQQGKAKKLHPRKKHPQSQRPRICQRICPLCQQRRKIRGYQTVEWQTILLLSSQPQNQSLAYAQSQGV